MFTQKKWNNTHTRSRYASGVNDVMHGPDDHFRPIFIYTPPPRACTEQTDDDEKTPLTSKKGNMQNHCHHHHRHIFVCSMMGVHVTAALAHTPSHANLGLLPPFQSQSKLINRRQSMFINQVLIGRPLPRSLIDVVVEVIVTN